MDRKVKSFRLRVDLLAWTESYAKERETSQIAVLEMALEHLRDLSRGGVPGLAASAAREPVRSSVPPSQQDYNLIRQQALNAAKLRAS